MRPRFALPSLAVLAALSLVLLARAPIAGAYQHVANGGFEQGLSGWIEVSGTTVMVVGADDTAPVEGSSSARIDLNGSDTILRYRIAGVLTTGSYTLSLATRSPSAGGAVSIMLLPDDMGQQHFDAAVGTATAEWTRIDGAVTIGQATEAAVTIRASGSAGAVVYIDDVRLNGAPPVTLMPTASATTTLPSTVIAHGTASTGTPTPTLTPTPSPFVDVISPALRNGGFEDLDAGGAPFAWGKYGGVLSSDARSHSGSRAARLDSATASTKWLHQTVIVQPGAWYAFDAWVLHGDAAVASAFLRVSWYTSADASGAAIDTADSTARLDVPSVEYRHLTTDAIAAPPDARSARVRVMLAPVSDAAASILVDDAAFYAVAPPPSDPTPVTTTAGVFEDETSPPSASGVERAPRSGARRASAASQAFDPSQRSSAGKIILNEVLYDADSDVPDADAEWVELYNASDAPIDVGGWSLRDGASVDPLPPFVVPARAFAIVAASNAFRDAYPDVTAPVAILASRIGNALGNDGDRLYLVDAAGVAVDAVSWGNDADVLAPAVTDVPSGHSIERRIAGVDSDRATDFVDNERPSPGRAFEAVGGKSKPRIDGELSVELLAGSGARNWDWLPWAFMAASAAACAGTVGWRVASTVRERVRQP